MIMTLAENGRGVCCQSRSIPTGSSGLTREPRGSAREMVALADEFRQLITQAGIPTPSIDAGYQYLSRA